MAGLAFLPWEEWLARLVHPLVVVIRRRFHRSARERLLAESQSWPETEGTVHQIVWDISNPREEIMYSYIAKGEYYSGSAWIWFESPNERQPHVGDKIKLHYNQQNPEESVFLNVA
jgi:hypothetical protein